MKIQTTKIYKQLTESNKRIKVFQGGTRSGKTYNILVTLIVRLLKEDNKTLTIARHTMPSLKNSVYRDFLEILQKMDLYDPKKLNKGDMTYTLGTNIIEFRNLDDDMKVRGAKRNYLFINEANEVPYPIFKQLIFRTTEDIILDYNPSDEFHWIYDEVITREDCDFFKSTYLDNPFLPEQQIQEIERLKQIDDNYWRIYGLGERGVSQATIFTNWEMRDIENPEGQLFYGLDFGFNDPNAFMKIYVNDDYIYVEEKLYKSHMTTPDIVDFLKSEGIASSDTIFADNSRPETIQEISRAGFNIHPCTKGQGSIKAGIDWMKRKKLYISKNSTNIIKEIKSYKWKVDKDERVLDDPVDLNNHSLDAIRYALSEKIKNNESFGEVISISI